MIESDYYVTVLRGTEFDEALIKDGPGPHSVYL